MGYFSELETMNANDRMETEPTYLEKLKSRLCYLEDKLASLESNRAADIWHDEIFADALPLYDYDEPDTASGLCKAISNIKKKIEAEYDRNMRMLEWRLSVLLNGETPEGQLAFSDMFSFSADAA
ncbi:MAG: hypothetical protein J6J15_05460 [Oscillospiraceae bacterium]|nr:hypothetical protein [Oscillospiraceae bacterium]